jgi:autotransporter-associated beta strand protein
MLRIKTHLLPLGKSKLFAAIFAVAVALVLTNAQATNQVQVNFDAGGGTGFYPFFSNSSGTAQNNYTLRMGTFNSATDADVEALGYNLLWVNNQFTVMTPSAGGVVTSSINSQAGSFSSDGSTDAFWTTSSASALSEQIWVVYSDSSTLTSSTVYGVASSTDSAWDMPASYSGTTTKELNTSQINVTAFGSTSGSGATGTIRTAANPATALYWDSNGAGGLGGTGTWSSSTSDTEWTNLSGGESVDGPYAWGTTSGTSYYAGAGLTAHFGGTAGTVTVSGTVQAHNGLTFASNSYSLTSGTINLAGGSAAANTITVTSSGHTAIISASLTGSNGMTKAGDGTARLDGTNTYTGSTTINAGTLQANAANSLQSTSGITVNSGGSLLVSATNAVNNSATITLAGGTVAMSGSGITDTVGTLTLSANSIIDLSNASGARTLTFADSSAISWTGTLQIWNWNGTNFHGTSYGDGDRQIFFGNSASGLTQTQLNSISFYSDSGSSFIGTGFIRSTGEIAAVPEPEVYATGVLLLLGLGIHLYRQKRRPLLTA